mmetsp:Transcript_16567/g.28188  ORF Transcript_16567/g.28188 Transcript_16567/m.28188 type:complete len:363 (+) Transcript_16567:1091-2179(+)
MFALRTVQKFRDRWEELEKENLRDDVQAKFDRAEFDKVYKEHYETLDQGELDRVVEDAIANAQSGDGEEALTDADKAIIGYKSRFLRLISTFYSPTQAAQHKAKMERLEKERLKSQGGDRAASALGSQKDASIHEDKSMKDGSGTYIPLIPEQWKEKIKDLRFLSVIKHPKIFQSLFYLLKYYDRSSICERDTNKLSWKKTKAYLGNDELFQKMSEYWPFGPKEDKFNEYQKLKFIQRNLETISEEQVDEYSVALGKVLRWVNLAVQFRIEDVRNRRRQQQALQEERKVAQEREAERVAKRDSQLEEAKVAFNEKNEVEQNQRKEEMGEEYEAEEMPEFDTEEFVMRFDDENPPIEIPAEIE